MSGPQARAAASASPALSSSVAALSPSARVVLGMIRLGRRSGYEIGQAVAPSIRFFWTLSPAQIYPALDELERARLVRGRNAARGRRKRRLYTVTRAGEAALQRWLAEPQPPPIEMRDPGLMKLFFADLVSHDDALAMLDGLARRSEVQADELQAMAPETAGDGGLSFPQVTRELGIALHRAFAGECRVVRRRLLSRPRGRGS